MYRPTIQARVSRVLVSTLGVLPGWLQRRVAGPVVTIDGNDLYTEVQAALRVLNANPDSSFERLPLDQARRQIDEEAWMFGSTSRLQSVEDIVIPSAGGDIPARRYTPLGDGPTVGTLVYFHGGGWVVGSLDSGHSGCAFLAANANVTVFAVDYRLAPEHPFPAGIDEATAAFRWIRDNASALGIDPRTIAVGGDSAGGNFAAVVSLDTKDDPDGAPAFQLLFFPVTDLSTKHRSYELFSDGYFLTEAQMDWYKSHYLAHEDDALDPRVSPLLAPDLGGLPPAYVAVSGFDVLRDEGLEYAARMQAAGVSVTTRNHTGHIHGFVNSTGVGTTSAAAMREAAAALASGLRAARERPTGAETEATGDAR